MSDANDKTIIVQKIATRDIEDTRANVAPDIYVEAEANAGKGWIDAWLALAEARDRKRSRGDGK